LVRLFEGDFGAELLTPFGQPAQRLPVVPWFVRGEMGFGGQGPGLGQRHARHHAGFRSPGRAGRHHLAAAARGEKHQRLPAKRRLHVSEALDGPTG
jgi:hypothetical protein